MMPEEKGYERKEKQSDKIIFFQIKKKYTTISIYAIAVIVIALIFTKIIMSWNDTRDMLIKFAETVSPFFLAVILAYFLNPLVKWTDYFIKKYIFKKLTPKKSKIITFASIILVYVFVLGVVGVMLTFVLPQVVSSITDLTNIVPKAYEKLADFLTDINKKYPFLRTYEIVKNLKEKVPEIVGYGTGVVGNIAPYIYSFSVSAVRMLINIVFAVMISGYMIGSKEFIKEQGKRAIYAVLNEKKGDTFCDTLRECHKIFNAFLLGKALDSLIIGIICFVAMSICRLPYAMLISLVVGVTNMIPYFGPVIGAIPGILIFLCTDFTQTIIFTIIVVILQMFDGLVLGPKILGDSTGLNPIWVIFAIIVGGAYFGVPGMFIGVPVVAVIAYLINKFIKYRLKGKNIAALAKYKKEN